MTNRFLPPAWLPWSPNLPIWPSLMNNFTPLQTLGDPSNQLNTQWWQQPIDANADATAPLPNGPWHRTVSASLRLAPPPLSTGGILGGAFAQPNDAEDENAPSFRGRGILGQFDQWDDPQSSSVGRGILASPEGRNSPWDQVAAGRVGSAEPATAQYGSSSTSIAVPRASQRTDANGVRLADMTKPAPGSWLPIAPQFPGTPGWTDHFIRSWQGIFDAIRPPKRKKIDEAECDAQYERDLFQCKMVGLRECYAQAMERYKACLAGQPVPPFNY